ncbi:MAG: hypothetical protein COA96_10340 [SAR86 cluster bacterium]|uniref:Uncharacterized protein n=1 Tax=SAR86 cluster bacterium TaxID=2030880 RepID=A0A2A5AY27_9GAMM|nr:MAG: hypothetical protein COA96_10340 [SAR86 cluster bacterium]
MKQKQKLETLLAKVEAKRTKHTPVLWFNDDAQALGLSISLLVRAYNGSLDAAHSLHKAMFSGWEWGRYSTIEEFTISKRGVPSDVKCSNHENPARAWLICIIKALISECDE